MPSQNIVKPYLQNSYYHVYARGASKQNIFLEKADYLYFLYILERHFSKKVFYNSRREPYRKLMNKLLILCYCLMTNHFHILVYQRDERGIESMMRSVMTAYTMYFNLKYKRSGPLFESTYKAILIDNGSYLTYISKYIHKNPRYWQRYKYSSISIYGGKEAVDWVNTEFVLGLFRDVKKYFKFLEAE